MQGPPPPACRGLAPSQHNPPKNHPARAHTVLKNLAMRCLLGRLFGWARSERGNGVVAECLKPPPLAHCVGTRGADVYGAHNQPNEAATPHKKLAPRPTARRHCCSPRCAARSTKQTKHVSTWLLLKSKVFRFGFVCLCCEFTHRRRRTNPRSHRPGPVKPRHHEHQALRTWLKRDPRLAPALGARVGLSLGRETAEGAVFSKGGLSSWLWQKPLTPCPHNPPHSRDLDHNYRLATWRGPPPRCVERGAPESCYRLRWVPLSSLPLRLHMGPPLAVFMVYLNL
jgi:hypothetical protein